MKIQFEGSIEEFLGTFGEIDPGINQELIDRNNILVEAIHLVSNARQVQADRNNFINQLRCLIISRENENKWRVQWEALAREAMNFVDRQLGGVTTEMSLSHRLKELERCIASNLTRSPLSQEVGIEVLRFSPHTDGSQTASEGVDTPASESQNVMDYI